MLSKLAGMRGASRGEFAARLRWACNPELLSFFATGAPHHGVGDASQVKQGMKAVCTPNEFTTQRGPCPRCWRICA